MQPRVLTNTACKESKITSGEIDKNMFTRGWEQ